MAGNDPVDVSGSVEPSGRVPQGGDHTGGVPGPADGTTPAAVVREPLASHPRASILVPFTSGCEHRERARGYVLDHYRQNHPEWELLEGKCDGTWSKGRALHDAASRARSDIFVVADADSFVVPEVLDEAVAVVEAGAPWVVPHLLVWRHTETATLDLYASGVLPELNRGMRIHRGPYRGVQGGGITVLSREAWDTVGGVDPRFEGWGGEDISFGWALETLCGPAVRLNGDLHHLWHPPAVTGRRQRGGPAEEALAARYRDAWRMPRLMRGLVDGEPPPPPPKPLTVPVVFRSRTPNFIARNGRHIVARFRHHQFETYDPDIAATLRLHPRVQEVA